MMYTEATFFEDNLKNKITSLQEEHKEVLKVIYDNAREIGAVRNFNLSGVNRQSMDYDEVKKTVDGHISGSVLDICLLDLERMGFVINTKKTEYGISILGLEYFRTVELEH